MKTYRLMKGVIVLALAALPFVFVGCGKDDAEQAEPGGNNTNTPDTPKHNVELVYNSIAENLHMDTINKYNSDPTVDTIFMVPYMSNMFSTSSTNGLQNAVRKLRERHNVNPNKIFGKGELQLRNASVENNPEIVRFFADTLRYTVTYRD